MLRKNLFSERFVNYNRFCCILVYTPSVPIAPERKGYKGDKVIIIIIIT